MDWLRSHMLEFVIPSLKRYAKEGIRFEVPQPRKHKYDEYLGWGSEAERLPAPKPTSMVYRPFLEEELRGTFRPAKGFKYEEHGLLKSALYSFGYKAAFDALLPAIESFSFANLRSIVGVSIEDSHSNLITQGEQIKYKPEDILHTLLKNSVKSLRQQTLKQNNKVVLLGRDVWVWAVLAQRFGLSHVFHPGVSRNVCYSHPVLRELGHLLGVRDGDILFDTGFAGTIHRHFSDATGLRLENQMLSSSSKDWMQFRNYGLARNRALFVEYLPKHFKTGTLNKERLETQALTNEFELKTKALIETKSFSQFLSVVKEQRVLEHQHCTGIVQYYNTLPQFLGAVLLTIWLYRHDSPKWVDSFNAQALRNRDNSMMDALFPQTIPIYTLAQVMTNHPEYDSYDS